MLVVKKLVRLVLGTSALGLVLSLGACAQTTAPSSVTPSEAATAPAVVLSGAWQLQSLTRPDSTVVSVSQPDRFTLQFVENSNRFSFRADCNVGNGRDSDSEY